MRGAAAVLLITGAVLGQDEPVVRSLNELFASCRPGATVGGEAVHETLGIVRRTPQLDAAGMFALVHPVASCCPRGIAVGLLVEAADVRAFAEGDEVTVRGRFAPLEVAPPLPRNRLARLAIGVLRTHLVLRATAVVRRDPLLDPERAHVLQRLDRARHATFLRALEATGWDEILRSPSYFTVLAPLEVAFESAPDGERAELFDPANRARLEALVKRHVIADRRTKRSLMSVGTVETVGGELPVTVRNGRLFVGGARVLFEDTSARNGVVISVDRVLRPD